MSPGLDFHYYQALFEAGCFLFSQGHSLLSSSSASILTRVPKHVILN